MPGNFWTKTKVMTEMLTFWVIALIMTGAALALLLPAFWGRYQSATTNFTEQNIQAARERLAELKQQHQSEVISDQEYEHQRSELEQALALDLESAAQAESSMLGDKRITHILVLAFLIPIMAFSLYFSLGETEVLLKSKGQQAQVQQAPAQHSMEELVAGLEQRLAANPENAQGWMMLGRTYMTLNRYADAAKAFAKVISQVGEKASVLLAQADALAMASGGRISGKPAELVKKALEQEPNNVTGLWLAGIAEEEQGNHKQAIAHWRKAEKFLVNNPQSLTELRGMIRRAEARSTGDKVAKVNKTTSASISVRVDIADQLINKVRLDDTVFIYARAVKGARMPLAIVKKKASELPVQVILNDEMAMMPSMALSNFPEVNIFARISRSGQATSQSGDLLGKVDHVSTTSPEIVSVKIDQVIP